MDSRSVVEFWYLAKRHGLNICIDGGWAVDAVLGRQTRPHNDLDIALPASEVAGLKRLLANLGFTQVSRPDSWEHNFVYESETGQVLDVHSYILNSDGSSAGGVPYIAEHLCGKGVVLGTEMRCVPPEWLVQFHTGYDLDRADWHDVRLLCQRFKIAIPKAYDKFVKDAPET